MSFILQETTLVNAVLVCEESNKELILVDESSHALTLVEGTIGATGTAATVTVGTTTTGAAGTNATVVNVGTTSAAVLDFTIPRGVPGVVAATAPITYNAGTQTVGIDPDYKPNPFDQSLNTGDDVQFNKVNTSEITFADSTVQTTAATKIPAPYDQNKNWVVAWHQGDYYPTEIVQVGVLMDNGVHSIDFDAVSVGGMRFSADNRGSYLTVSGFGITFNDGTSQTTAATSPDLTPYLLKTEAASTYYPLTNPSGYITSSALSPYLLSSTAASTYYPLSSNPAGYLTTSAAASTYYPLTNPSAYITTSALTPYALISSLGSAAYEPTTYWIQSPTVAATDGQIPAWDSATSKPVWIDNAARTLFITAKNQSGSTIPACSVVYISGATGANPLISLAQANAEATSATTIGITSAAIANGATGQVVTSGLLTKVDTSDYPEGTGLYLSATTAGGFTTTLPQAPNHGVYLGVVTRSHANQGAIEVTIKNYQELEEMSDVLISTPANGDLLVYETASSLWKNKTASSLDLATMTWATAAFAPAGWNPFNQTLNTTDEVAFRKTTLADGGAGLVVIDPYWLGTGITHTVGGNVAGITALNGFSHTNDTSTISVKASTGITFPDGTTQSSAATTPDLTPYAQKAVTNTFSANQVISVTDNTNAALRVTQLGTGEALRIEDSANPDSSPFVVTSIGDVGIGLTNITSKLHVVAGTGPTALFSAPSSAGLNTAVTINNASTGASFVVNHNNTSSSNDAVRITNLGTGNSFVVEDSTSPDASPFVINQNGNVGIGTTLPTSTLQVVGTLLASSAGTSVSPFFRFEATNTGSTQDVLRITNGTLGNSFVVYDQASDTTPFIVDAGGNVGVKTASPTTDFDVAGNAKFTTADITSAPAAGDSSTKVPTTAWVQAEVPTASTSTAGKVQLATDAQAIAGTSATTAITPAALSYAGWLDSLEKNDFTSATFSTALSGQSVAQLPSYKTLNNGFSTAIGHSIIYVGYQVKKGQGPESPIDFSKKVTVEFISNRNNTPSTGSVFRMFAGRGQLAMTPGDLAAAGFGVKVEGSGVLKLMAHNGTTLTTINTSYTPTNIAYNCKVVSDGTGNVTCFVNDVQVGTTTGGPTGLGMSYGYNIGFEFQNTSVVATGVKQNVGSIKIDLGTR